MSYFDYALFQISYNQYTKLKNCIQVQIQVRSSLNTIES